MSELVNLRKKAEAHDDYLVAIRVLRAKSYGQPAGEYANGYLGAMNDLMEALLDTMAARLESQRA